MVLTAPLFRERDLELFAIQVPESDAGNGRLADLAPLSPNSPCLGHQNGRAAAEVTAGCLQSEAGQRFALRADVDAGLLLSNVLFDPKLSHGVGSLLIAFETLLHEILPEFDAVDAKRPPVDGDLLDPFLLTPAPEPPRQFQQVRFLLRRHVVDHDAELATPAPGESHLVIADVHVPRVVEDDRVGDE